MPALSKLKKDMEFMRDMEEIVDIFKMTAMFQFGACQKKEKINDIFENELAGAWSLLLRGEEEAEGVSFFFNKKKKKRKDGVSTHALLEKKEEDLPTVSVLVATDYGFLGGLNARVINEGVKRRSSQKDEVIVLGELGAHYLEERGIPFTFFQGIDDEISHDRIKKLSDYLLENYNRRFRRVLLIYPKFISLGMQRIETVDLLPYGSSSESKSTEERAASRTSKKGHSEGQKLETKVLIQQGEISVEKMFIELWVEHKLLEVFLSSKLSEYAARIMHLEGSWQEIFHLKEKLVFDYFRERHAMQDQTIREISASKVLLKK